MQYMEAKYSWAISLFLFVSLTCNDLGQGRDFQKGYQPKNLEDALNYLTCLWDDSAKTYFKNLPEKEAVLELHLSYSRIAIRGGWNLWKGSNELSSYFNNLGIHHPDDMSSIIVTSFHRRLNSKPLELQKQLKHYIDSWEKRIENTAKMEVRNKAFYDRIKEGVHLKILLEVKPMDEEFRAVRLSKAALKNRRWDNTDLCTIEGAVISKKAQPTGKTTHLYRYKMRIARLSSLQAISNYTIGDTIECTFIDSLQVVH